MGGLRAGLVGGPSEIAFRPLMSKLINACKPYDSKGGQKDESKCINFILVIGQPRHCSRFRIRQGIHN